jgi:hypothetical protein
MKVQPCLELLKTTQTLPFNFASEVINVYSAVFSMDRLLAALDFYHVSCTDVSVTKLSVNLHIR